jgi:hypothetical protein
MRCDTLRTGVPIPSEISFVAPLDSNGATKHVALWNWEYRKNRDLTLHHYKTDLGPKRPSNEPKITVLAESGPRFERLI